LDGSTGTLQYSLNDGSTAGTYFRNPTSVTNATQPFNLERRGIGKTHARHEQRQNSTARA
jgi:hypothetical protein